VKKAFRVGDRLQVVVENVDAVARRIRLSVAAVQKMQEADEVRQYAERTEDAPPGNLGSLADKVREALKKPS